MNIAVQNLHHVYFNKNGTRLQALQEINLKIKGGEFLSLIGPSGCGKSTLIRILAGLLKPTEGTVQLGGMTPQEVSSDKQIAWLAQNPALLPWKTVQENVSLAQTINPKNDRHQLPPEKLLGMVGLSDFCEAYPFTLSGGMQQRVALARTLALGAKVWLMDEPFAALDELTRGVLISEVAELWKRFRPTVLWVTHHIYEAIRLADRIIVMTPRPGKIIADFAIHFIRPREESSVQFQNMANTVRKSIGVRGNSFITSTWSEEPAE